MQPEVQYRVGIDEVGRGPLAGPLCVGACLVRARSRHAFLRGVKDSKQLSECERFVWEGRLRRVAAEKKCRLATVFVGVRRIDREGLASALKRAVCRALRKLCVEPRACRVLLDGSLYAPRTFVFQKTIISGDETEPLIAAASIIAKVRRDRYMAHLARTYPQYGFEKHKGYGTKKHYEALRRHGISPVHRRSFLRRFIQNAVGVERQCGAYRLRHTKRVKTQDACRKTMRVSPPNNAYRD